MLLADFVLQRGGWVCGAVLDSSMTVRHIVTRDRNMVDAMRGSKYVQSEVACALGECLAHLRDGDEVFFTGTACQVDAMRSLAGNALSDRLLTADVLCHGAPSPAFWQAYLDYRGSCEGAVVTGARFRKKTPSWTVFSMELIFGSGVKRAWPCDEDLYLRAFLGDYITRDACHICPYTGTGRVSDVTLADFWGYVSESRKDRNTEKGISLVLANTSEGACAIEAIAKRTYIVEKPLSEAVRGNVPLRRPFKANPKAEEFWEAFDDGGVEAVRSTFLGKKKPSKKHLLSLWFNDHAYLLPTFVRRRVVNWRNNSK